MSKEWASIAGACQIVDDREKIKELYSSSLRMVGCFFVFMIWTQENVLISFF
jgi:hypothetical protein